MKRIILSLFISILLATGFTTLPAFKPSVIYAQSGKTIQSQEMNLPGIIVEITQCKRNKGVLTIKVRVKNTGTSKIRILWRDVKKTVYLMDEENHKKYFVLKDADGDYIYSGDPWDMQPNSSKISWFKFPAPPFETDEITVILPECAPFEDIPIMDR